MKRKFYSELAYVIGIITLAFGTALMEKADMGLSMVVAPAYLVHRKLVETFSWFSFGVAEYTFQALLLVVMIIVLRKFKVSYLFSFVTAVIYGVVLDLIMLGTALIPSESIVIRVVCYILGMIFCAIGVASVFHTYIAPEVYELFVKEVSNRYHFPIGKCKTVYDCISCAVAIIMSFVFFGFGHFEGIKWGTVICALVNGTLIGKINALMEKKFEFVDRFSLHGTRGR